MYGKVFNAVVFSKSFCYLLNNLAKEKLWNIDGIIFWWMCSSKYYTHEFDKWKKTFVEIFFGIWNRISTYQTKFECIVKYLREFLNALTCKYHHFHKSPCLHHGIMVQYHSHFHWNPENMNSSTTCMKSGKKLEWMWVNDNKFGTKYIFSVHFSYILHNGTEYSVHFASKELKIRKIHQHSIHLKLMYVWTN